MPESAGTLPFPSAILNRDWDTLKWITRPVGEVPNLIRRTDWRRPPAPPFGPHVCGTEQDHGKGGDYRPELPPVLYRADGLPVCCSPARRAGWGGWLTGGSASVWVRRHLAGYGGLLSGGRAVAQVVAHLAGSGGLLTGGSAHVEQLHTAAGSGGLLTGGTAAVTLVHPLAGAGGMLTGGTATVTVEHYGTDYYSVNYSGAVEVLDRTAPLLWEGVSLTLTADGLGGWYLIQDDTFDDWVTAGWDGTGTRTFTPDDPDPPPVDVTGYNA